MGALAAPTPPGMGTHMVDTEQNELKPAFAEIYAIFCGGRRIT